ncbi:lysophospholipid acyltransferase family protein [Wansuia hejianensis]|uniref:1-acyl-sn-glycerol-3-phosphate acyltransferase n=1 Tax=Wansuia hejianensis TaxID=2763667 RepID=A0A926EX32_9FIRM|nr:lysophospholipid acyltransferase family protein [Wansuia hejianensis]MBC8590546.1 1-acyl-sn-glycerol-3-phosphate acyltransferase [Wansuia hejianensis]
MFYKLIRVIGNIILRMIFRIRISGKENVPMDGRFILCANHISNWDPVLISIVIPRQISWMAKKELFKTKTLSFILKHLGVFPVSRGDTDISAIKKSIRILKDEKVLGIFPEGTRVKEINLDNAKTGVALLSLRSNSPILPVYIESTYKLFSRVNIYIGKPLYFNEYSNKKPTSQEYNNISKEILNTIYRLKEMSENE